jgi:peptide/nickel transport system substrate-binding protein
MAEDGRNGARRRIVRRTAKALAVALLAVALASCGGDDEQAGDEDGTQADDRDRTTLTIGIAGDPETLDPAWGQAHRANETIKNLHAQWVRYAVTDTGEGYMRADLPNVEGDAIESFTLEEDNTVIRFKIRENANFPDGTPITTDDFIFKLERSVGVNAGSAWVFNTAGGITDPNQIEKVNDKEFLMRLAAPAPILGPLLRDQDAGLEHTSVVRENMTDDDEWGEEYLARNGAPTGAYLLDSWTRGTSLVLKANPEYWGEAPFFDTVVLQIIPSPENRVQLLRNGSIDIAAELSVDAIVRLKDAPGVRVISVPSINRNVLGFVQDKPPFDDVRVRQAIAHAIPYEALARDVLHGEALTPKGVWPQNSIWFEDVPWPYGHDPDRARELLAEAGHEDGLSFTVEIREGDADAEALAVPLQTELRNIGVEMNITKLAPAQFQGNLGDRSMQAWIQSNLGSFVDDPYYEAFLWYSSDAVINWFRYSNSTVDDITARLKTEIDQDERRVLARQLQEQLNEDLPAITLAEPNYLIAMRDDIEGFLYEPDSLLTYRLFSRR